MKDPDKPSPVVDPVQRRPYEAPAIEETSPFETLALACVQNAVNCGNYYEPNPSQYDNS
jgi:hypothetical protein